MYGDVENDEELMAELLALEAEERAAGRILPTASSLSQAHAVSPLSLSFNFFLTIRSLISR